MIYLDIDGVLADTVTRAVEVVGAYLGEKPTAPVPQYGMEYAAFPEHAAAARVLFDEVWATPEFYRHLLPIEGALEFAHWLTDKGILGGYITSRAAFFIGEPERDYVAAITRNWLDEMHFPRGRHGIIWHENVGKPRYELIPGGSGLFIDDNPSSVVETLDSDKDYGEHVVGWIFRTSYNKHIVEALNIPAYDNFDDIKDALRKLHGWA